HAVVTTALPPALPICQSLALREEPYPGHWLVPSSVSHLGAIVGRSRFAEAESLLIAGERGLLAARGAAAQPVKDARQRLVNLYPDRKGTRLNSSHVKD